VTAPGESDRVRLDYLDGLRGLTAVYVVLGHIYVSLRFFSPDVVLPPFLMKGLSVFSVGKLAVDIFIVLSGYCLMLPVLSAGGHLKGGFSRYLKRRATRIIPPYYAAIVLSLFVIWLCATTRLMQTDWGDFRFDVIGSHLLLVHNWSREWNPTINPPMWSVATEWQIYFVFPFLLLPVWRRFGPVASIVVGFAAGLAPHFLLGGFLDWAFPWFIGLFALGMASAWVSMSNDPTAEQVGKAVPWAWVTVVEGAGIIAFCLSRRGWYLSHEWIADPIIGVSAASLLVFCTKAIRAGRPARETPLIVRFLGSPPAVRLGHFSYSIYLVHYPLMILAWHLQMRLPMSSTMRAVVMYGVAFPFIIVLAYVFHLAFERRFMPGLAVPRRALAEERATLKMS
jgi:peptidoglycan/LPS O-acetylase OafA/YrhL